MTLLNNPISSTARKVLITSLTSLFKGGFVAATTFVALFGCGPKADAAPASGVPVLMTAPDGSEIWVRAVGDENCRHFETLDGEVVDWMPQVVQQLAPRPIARSIFPKYLRKPAPDQAIRPGDGMAVISRPATEAKGGAAAAASNASGNGIATPGSEARFLIVLVEFPDRHFSLADPYAGFNELINGDNYTVGGSCGSAREYFEDSSTGLFSPVFDVVGPVTMQNNAAYYASVGTDDSPATNMVIEACRLLDGEIDFSDYDLDGDGVCDNVYFFFAGRGQADGGGKTTIWPHSATLSVFGRSLRLDGVAIENYACSPEQNGSNRFTGIGTFCHEFCHVLGLPDLYYNGGSLHPGYYSLMASGNYNNNGYTPPLLSSFERYSLGWISPEEISASGETTLLPLGGQETVRKITSENPDEYFLLENRRNEGWDAYLPGHGMLVWHIDYDPDAWDSNMVNNSKRRLVDLVRANGTGGAGLPFPGTGGITSFTDITNPSLTTRAGESLGVGLTGITETPEGNIIFMASVQGAGIEELPSLPADNAEITAIYSIDGRLILSNPDSASIASLPAGLYIRRFSDGHSDKYRKL